MNDFPEYPHQGYNPGRPGTEGYLPTDQEPARTAFLQAAAPIREWVYSDAAIRRVELENLYIAVAFQLGNPQLSARTALQFSELKKPRIVMRRFRREAGVPLVVLQSPSDG